jgi:hypothetical protein
MEKREPAALLVPRLTVSLFAAIKFRKPGDVKDLLSFRSTFSAGPRHKDFLLKITMRYLANGFPEPAIRCRGIRARRFDRPTLRFALHWFPAVCFARPEGWSAAGQCVESRNEM